MDLRLGQASRHGYIVIAPEWTDDQYQSSYEYSAQEHSRVLYALQESLHRFAIDTDRVFLTDIASEEMRPGISTGTRPMGGRNTDLCHCWQICHAVLGKRKARFLLFCIRRDGWESNCAERA